MTGERNSFEQWRERYHKSGNTKSELINWLKNRPQDCQLLFNDILEHLEASQSASEKTSKSRRNLEHESIYQYYVDGPFQSYDPFEMMTGFLSNSTVGRWADKNHKEKLYELTKIFPNYRTEQLADIIVAQQNRISSTTER